MDVLWSISKCCISWLSETYIIYSFNCKRKHIRWGKRENKHISKEHTRSQTHGLRNEEPDLDSWFCSLVHVTSAALCKSLYNGHSAACPTSVWGFTVRLDSHKASEMLCKEPARGGCSFCEWSPLHSPASPAFAGL